jgi:hypothetical protein
MRLLLAQDASESHRIDPPKGEIPLRTVHYQCQGTGFLKVHYPLGNIALFSKAATSVGISRDPEAFVRPARSHPSRNRKEFDRSLTSTGIHETNPSLNTGGY